jgi:hypothetical protein
MTWLRVLNAVFGYWYARGLADALPRFSELALLLEGAWEERRRHDEERLLVSLDEGVEAAERLLDEARPMAASLCIGNHEFGELAYHPGAERLAGRHMRQNLTTCLHREYVEALIASGRLSILPSALTAHTPQAMCQESEGHAVAAAPHVDGDASSH